MYIFLFAKGEVYYLISRYHSKRMDYYQMKSKKVFKDSKKFIGFTKKFCIHLLKWMVYQNKLEALYKTIEHKYPFLREES